MNYRFNKNFLSIAFYLINSASLRLCAFALIFSSLTLAQNTRAHDEEPFCTVGEQQLGNPINKEDIEKLPLPNDKNDPANVDISDSSVFDKRCWDGKPFFKKDCSYVSTFAEENSQNPILRQCRLGGFFIACNDSSNEMHACFSYQGEFKTLEIAGDFTDWKPVALEVRREKTGYSAPCFNFSKTARVEYKLIVDGKWITDPANPNKIDNGMGGENSFFTMPDYKPTVWDKSVDDREDFLTMYGF